MFTKLKYRQKIKEEIKFVRKKMDQGGNLFRIEEKFIKIFKEELEEKKILRDIKITAKELDLMREIIEFNLKNSYLKEEEENLVLARYLVEIGYENYDEKKYWDYLFETLGADRKKYYGVVSSLFIKTLKKNKIRHVDEGKKFVSNIILNTYVPKNYLEGFYQFLENFYIKELSQTIDEEILDEEIDILQNYLEKDENFQDIEKKLKEKPTTYHLLKPVKNSMHINRLEFKKYLKNYLRVFDSYWWDETEKTELIFEEEREIFEEWFRNSKSIREKNKKCKSEKLFKRPTINYSEKRGSFILYIPRQKIREEDFQNDLQYKIIQNDKIIKRGQLFSFFSSGRILTEQEKIVLDGYLYKSKFIIESGGEEINRFNLFQEPFMVFNSKFENENIKNLKIGENYIIYSEEPYKLITSESEYIREKGIAEYIHPLDQESIIQIGDEDYYLGKNEATKLIGKIERKLTLKDDSEIPIYKFIPEIYLKTELSVEKIRLDINGKKMRVSENIEGFKKDENGIVISLDKYSEAPEGNFNIEIIDMDRNKSIYKKTIYVVDIDLEFDREVYVFEEKVILKHLKNEKVKHNYYKNELGLEVNLNELGLNLYHLENRLWHELPIFKWKLNNENWEIGVLEKWHKDFKGNLKIFFPKARELKLKFDGTQVIIGERVGEYFNFNLNFLSENFNGLLKNLYEINLIVDGKSFPIGNVRGKMDFQSVEIGYQINSQKLIGQFEILGKGKYFLIVESLDGKFIDEFFYDAKKDRTMRVVMESLNTQNRELKIYLGVREVIEDDFFGGGEEKREIIFQKEIKEKREPETIEALILRVGEIKIETAVHTKENYPVKSFNIEILRKEKESEYFQGKAYYHLFSGEKKYFSCNNPFRFKVENNFIVEIVDRYEEVLIYDKFKKRLITDEPIEEKKDYDRLIIPDRLKFTYEGETLRK